MARHTKTARRQAFRRHCTKTLPLDVGAFSFFLSSHLRRMAEAELWSGTRQTFALMRDLAVPVMS